MKLKTVIDKAIDVAAKSETNHLADQIPQGIFGRRGYEKYKRLYSHGSEDILSNVPKQQPKIDVMDFGETTKPIFFRLKHSINIINSR